MECCNFVELLLMGQLHLPHQLPLLLHQRCLVSLHCVFQHLHICLQSCEGEFTGLKHRVFSLSSLQRSKIIFVFFLPVTDRLL